MSLALIPQDLAAYFEDRDLRRFLSDLPVGFEVDVTRAGADHAWIFTTEHGWSKIYRAVVSYYSGLGQTTEIVVRMREMGKNAPERIWSSWQGHIKG